ncbi:MAG: hypothetical protein MHMPM18_003953, partial [Marteilia pararefringens]
TKAVKAENRVLQEEIEKTQSKVESLQEEIIAINSERSSIRSGDCRRKTKKNDIKNTNADGNGVSMMMVGGKSIKKPVGQDGFVKNPSLAI